MHVISIQTVMILLAHTLVNVGLVTVEMATFAEVRIFWISYWARVIFKILILLCSPKNSSDSELKVLFLSFFASRRSELSSDGFMIIIEVLSPTSNQQNPYTQNPKRQKNLWENWSAILYIFNVMRSIIKYSPITKSVTDILLIYLCKNNLFMFSPHDVWCCLSAPCLTAWAMEGRP